jgi:hypothetical protein
MDVNKTWQRKKNILFFDGGWQLPAKTEFWAFESFQDQLPYSPFIELVCFPWANLIDFQRKNPLGAAWLIEALQNIPPRTTLKRATVCQHIYALDLLPWFNKLKITDLLWSHATKIDGEIEGIKIHPFPLYPYAYASSIEGRKKPLDQREYVYSFLGAYDPSCYLTDIREAIFSLPKNEVSLIKKTSSWHFEELVYKKQILGDDLDASLINQIKEKETLYLDTMSNTIFSLCPSGSGPNTIRFWESLMLGCIPVVQSDQWRAPSFLNKKNIIFLREDEHSLNEWIEWVSNQFQSSDLSKFKHINQGLSLDNLCMLSLPDNFLDKFS